jgi:hypothetical protein
LWALQVLIEQLLRQQAIPPPTQFDHLHRQTSGLADQLLIGRQPQESFHLESTAQHLPGREFEQLVQARQNMPSASPFEQLLRQRQLEDHQQQQQQQVIPFSIL